MYFVIYIGDGDVLMESMTKQEFQSNLNNNHYGDNPVFLNEMPSNSMNPVNWPSQTYIVIKGDISPPEAKEVVTKWEAK